MSFGYQVLGFGSFPNRGGPIIASGGTETTSGDYTIHTFTSSGTFSVSRGGDMEYLVLAGAGGGGSHYGGGGGAGGFRAITTTKVSAADYTVTIGAGGAGGVYNDGGSVNSPGTIGSNSVFNSITSNGGGGGGARMSGNGSPATDGGSGGGGGNQSSGTTPGNGTTLPVAMAG